MLDVATYNLLRSFIKRGMSEYPGSTTNNSTSLEYKVYNNSLLLNKCYESQFLKGVIKGRTIKCVFSDGVYIPINFSSTTTTGSKTVVNNSIPIDFNKKYFMVYDVIDNTMPVPYYICKPSSTTQFSNSNLISAGNKGVFVIEMNMRTDKKYSSFTVSAASEACTTGSITYRRELYECPADFTLEDFNTTYMFDFPNESIFAQDDDWVTITRDSTNPDAKSKLAIPEITTNKKFVLLVDIAENTMNKRYSFCNSYNGYPFKFNGSVEAKSIGLYRFIIETVSDLSNVTNWMIFSQTSDNRCQGSITFKRILIDYNTYTNTRYNPALITRTPSSLYINNNSFDIHYELNGISTYNDEFHDEFIFNEDGSGEYVQQIGKIVVNGDSDIIINTSATNQTETIAWQLNKNANTSIKPADNADSFETLALKFTSGSKNTLLNEDYEQVGSYSGCIYGRLLRSEISSADVDGIKAYFKANPMTVYYVMRSPVVTHIPYESMPIYKIQEGSNIFRIPGRLNCKATFRVPSDVGSYIKSLEERISELETMVIELSSLI